MFVRHKNSSFCTKKVDSLYWFWILDEGFTICDKHVYCYTLSLIIFMPFLSLKMEYSDFFSKSFFTDETKKKFQYTKVSTVLFISFFFFFIHKSYRYIFVEHKACSRVKSYLCKSILSKDLLFKCSERHY